MTAAEIRVFDNLEKLSWAVAADFENLARTRSLLGGKLTAALSGGSTPRVLFQVLSSTTMAGRIRWQNVHLFQVDERCVPLDHAESNYRMIRETLLEPVGFPEKNFHCLQAERPNREEACQAYADDMRQIFQVAPGALPRFDLILLGMGNDGHTASLFPGTEALGEKHAWVRANYVEKLKMFRLTLTFPVLNAAERVVFLVSGADKAPVLKEVLEGPPGCFPAQGVQPTNGKLSWFVDKAAAQLLSKR